MNRPLHSAPCLPVALVLWGLSFLLCAGSVPLDATQPVPNDYVDTGFVAGPVWLNKRLGHDSVVVIDARGSATAYGLGHIPGALHAEWQEFADMSGSPTDPGFAVLLPRQQLSAKLAGLGIDADKTVVVYADTRDGWGEDGRLVWMLRMCGVPKSKMLNGGIGLWKDHGFPLERRSVEPTPTAFEITSLDSGYVATTEYVQAHIDSVVILDSRTEAEYRGTAHDWNEARTGRLPGAVHLPFHSVYRENGAIKSQRELLDLFAGAGIDNNTTTIVSYCTGGIRSALLTIVLRMAGFDNARNYDGSFWEWAAIDSLDVVVSTR